MPLKTFAKSECLSAFPIIFEETANAGTSEEAGKPGLPFTGYIKKGVYYYKTRGRGKAINVNATHLNKLFSEKLKMFEFDRKYTKVLRGKMNRLLNEKLKDYLHEQTLWKKRLAQIDTDIEKLEQRFIKEELSKDLFEKYEMKFKAEKKEIVDKLSTKHFTGSNLGKAVDKCLTIASNIKELWSLADYDGKTRLQSLIFPEGILYNKEKDRVRTIRTNSLFAQIPPLVSASEDNRKSHSSKSGSNSHWVVPTGIEPVSKV